MIWRVTDPEGNEAGKVKFDIVRYTRGVVLDLGCGPSKAFPHFLGIDNGAATEQFGQQMKPDLTVPDCADLGDAVESASCDAVFSSHLLEHIQDTEAALRDWWRCLKVGGYLVLYLPHRDLYPNVGQPGSNPDHKHDFVNADILRFMMNVGEAGFELVVNEVRDADMEYSFLQVYRKRDDGNMILMENEKPEKSVCVCRFGGFGDMIQASNIFPELKRQGYHITVMTTPRGQDVIKENPFVDDWFIQDENQVPNGELGAFWRAQAKHYDKFINLSESVEGTLLALPGRTNHTWPDSVRRKRLGINYLEFTAELAEMPYTSEAKFYPRDDEVKQAKDYLAHVKNDLAGEMMIGMRAPDRFNILWILSGSSIHKFYPWQDVVIAKLMLEIPEAVIVFNGDYACQILEAGWEKEPRVRCESGNMSIRQSLTLAQHVDCVVGPETGVLNAVAFEPVAKVIMLSHSSKQNLSLHWVNTSTMEPENTECYPCHRLHYGREFCHEHVDSGAAICQANITPERVFSAIKKHYDDWKLLKNVMEIAA